jgi:tRNA(Ile2) C34 agmatinyltransferase TiaS
MSVGFKIDRRARRVFVTKGGEVVWGPGGLMQAEEELERLERKARRKMRNCMKCRGEFMSQGVGHRMCSRCRHPKTTAEDVAV